MNQVVRWGVCAAVVLATDPGASLAWQAAGQDPAPRILLDAAPRAIEYQLERLSNGDLIRVERKADDARYRLVYLALLTRKGLGREYAEEALGALTKLDKSSRTAVLLEALAKVPAEDSDTADRLSMILLSQPVADLRAERARFDRAIEGQASPGVLQAAYGGVLLTSTDPRPVLTAAAGHEGHVVALLRSVPQLGTATTLRAALFAPIAALSAESKDSPTRAAAITALASTRPDAATFHLIASEVGNDDVDVRTAAIRALQRFPKEAWPPADIAPLVRTLTAAIGAVEAEQRTESPAIDALQLAEKIADALPDEARRTARRDLRGLGVRVIRVETIPEQMAFDVKWFAVQAGKPVQIVLFNPDVMSHNLLVSRPGSLQQVAQAGGAMPVSSDPAVKPFVPDSPLVLQATRLLTWGETERLSFTAPTEPGEYPFLCTFPGHWVRMYGVMLVVPDLESWEAKRTVPTDPVTNKPFASERH